MANVVGESKSNTKQVIMSLAHRGRHNDILNRKSKNLIMNIRHILNIIETPPS